MHYRNLIFSGIIATILLAGSVSAQVTEKKSAEPPKQPEQIAKKTNDTESWYFEQHEDGKGGMKVEGDAIVFTTKATSSEPWHVQVHQNGFKFEDGDRYRVKFSMKSPDRVFVVVNAQAHAEPWQEIGLHEEIVCQSEYQDYDFTFSAYDVNEETNRFGIQLGHETGAVYVKNLSITKMER